MMKGLRIGYITRGRSLRVPQGRGNVNQVERDVTNLYHGEHLTRFEDRNSGWPKLMVGY